jgi:small subunit ribosomal protein S7
MARSKKIKKREKTPDFKYNSVLVSDFINHIMKRGKKSTARKIMYDCFDIIKKETKKDPLEVFEKAIENISPALEVKPRRVGGATYQIPIEVNGERKVSLAIRWILKAARSKKGQPMREKLAKEILDSFNNTGTAIKQKENTHRMAEANRAFAHFAR